MGPGPLAVQLTATVQLIRETDADPAGKVKGCQLVPPSVVMSAEAERWGSNSPSRFCPTAKHVDALQTADRFEPADAARHCPRRPRLAAIAAHHDGVAYHDALCGDRAGDSAETRGPRR